jgi:hypothetical protein
MLPFNLKLSRPSMTKCHGRSFKTALTPPMSGLHTESLPSQRAAALSLDIMKYPG